MNTSDKVTQENHEIISKCSKVNGEMGKDSMEVDKQCNLNSLKQFKSGVNNIPNVELQEREFDIRGDDIYVSVHALEDEFQSEDEDDQQMMSESLIDETVVEVPESQNERILEVDHAVSVNEADNRRYSEIQRMKNDPLFKEMVGQAVTEQMRFVQASNTS